MRAVSPAVPASASPSDDEAWIARIEELTRRVMVCVATLVACTAAVAPFYRLWFELALRPMRASVAAPGPDAPAVIAVYEPTFAYVRACVVPGAMLAMPVLCYHAWAFVCGPARGTPPPFVWRVGAAGTLSFAAGVVASYLFLVPAFAGFVGGPGALRFPTLSGVVVTLDTYVAAVMNVLIGMGLAFQLPAALRYLARAGLVRPERPAAGRRYAIVGAFVYAAVLTPTPDPFTQTMVALPIVVLWELGAQLARVTRPAPAASVH